jgi:hypothetical protein
MSARFACAALAVALSACTEVPPVRTTAPAVPVVQAKATTEEPALSRTDSLLLYFSHVRKMSPAELAREHESVRRDFAKSRSDFNRMRLAMLLSLPNTGIYDGAHALSLLEPLTRNPQETMHSLALLISTQLEEQSELATRVHGMQRKLEQLKSLERTLIQREQGSMPK